MDAAAERRTGQEPVPENHETYLNPHQASKLSAIEKFGWKLKFIGRPLFQNPVVIVVSSDNCTIGLLDEDCLLDLNPDIVIRD